jgi:hypothetical protein
MKSENVLLVEVKGVYGKELWYPVGPAKMAAAVVGLTGKLTINPFDVGCLNALGITVEEDRPKDGKIYALTGGRDSRCIMNGNTWAESEVEK